MKKEVIEAEVIVEEKKKNFDTSFLQKNFTSIAIWSGIILLTGIVFHQNDALSAAIVFTCSVIAAQPFLNLFNNKEGYY